MNKDFSSSTGSILPEFQRFLIARRLVPQKNVPFYAYWVSKFLYYSNNNEDPDLDMRIRKFLKHLGDKEVADWQIKQAQTAIQLYIGNFLNGDESSLEPNKHEAREKNFSDCSAIIRKMKDAMRLKHYSYRTERSYIDWVKRFFAYMEDVKKKDPGREGADSSDVRDFLSYLAIRKRVSSSTQNQAFNALLFLFRDVLKTDLTDLGKTVRAKRGPKLPVVLSVEEVQELFRSVKGKELLMLKLLYGAGLRLMELVRLRVKDIDFDSNLIFVRSGKGDKDRRTILPESIKSRLARHLDDVKVLHEEDLAAGYGEVYLPDALERKYPNAAKQWCWQYAFPSSKLSIDPRSGKIRRHHISGKTVQNAMRKAVKRAGIPKHATVHTLRHSFATHLLMNGVNIREVQELLGHKNVETTMVYTHVIREMANIPESPLDRLYSKGSKAKVKT